MIYIGPLLRGFVAVLSHVGRYKNRDKPVSWDLAMAGCEVLYAGNVSAVVMQMPFLSIL